MHRQACRVDVLHARQDRTHDGAAAWLNRSSTDAGKGGKLPLQHQRSRLRCSSSSSSAGEEHAESSPACRTPQLDRHGPKGQVGSLPSHRPAAPSPPGRRSCRPMHYLVLACIVIIHSGQLAPGWMGGWVGGVVGWRVMLLPAVASTSTRARICVSSAATEPRRHAQWQPQHSPKTAQHMWASAAPTCAMAPARRAGGRVN